MSRQFAKRTPIWDKSKASRLAPLYKNVTAFMAGGEFWPLWTAVMDATSVEDFTEPEAAWFDALYDLVYMAQPDPVQAADARDGIIGAAELRKLIREHGLDVFPPAAGQA
jgi:hypothetical protein